MQDPARSNYASFEIKVNGSPLPAAHVEKVLRLAVERALHLPDTVMIVFQDSGPIGQSQELYLNLTNANLMPIGAEVEVSMGYGDRPQPVFKGEVTAHELDIEEGGQPLFVVRGYDKRHRLQRGRVTKTYLQVKDSDIAQQLAGASGLSPSVDETSIVHEYVLQNNQTNWECLQQLAARNGFETGVDGNTLYFRKPRTDSGPQQRVTLWENMLHLNLRMSSAGQAPEVKVLGWDPKQKQAVVGSKPASAAATWGTPAVNTAARTAAAGFASDATLIVADVPVWTQDEADQIAQATVSEMAGNVVYIDAEILGDPDLKPGTRITLERLGPRFSGDYFVSTVTHKVSHAQRYTTSFTVGGHRSDSLLELVAASPPGAGHGGASAVVIGIVTNNKDEEGKQGRVKVKFPWLGDQVESQWARIAVPSAGGGRGMYWLPEVNDEVLVAFEHGDVSKPYVIGALWNGVDAPPKPASETVGGDGKVNLRILQSRTGHVMTMDDTESKEKVTIVTKGGHTVEMDDGSSPHILVKSNGGHQVKLDDQAKKVTVADSSGSNTIVIETTSNKITVQSAGDLELSATNNVTIKGLKVSIQATTDAEISGLQAKLSGQTQVEVSGAQASVKGEAMVQIQGAIVQLN